MKSYLLELELNFEEIQYVAHICTAVYTIYSLYVLYILKYIPYTSRRYAIKCYKPRHLVRFPNTLSNA